MQYLCQFLILIAFSFAGEALRSLISLPIPPSVYGLLLLFVCLQLKLVKLHHVKNAADFLIQIMPIMFIPAGVALMDVYTELLPISKAAKLLLIIALTTILVLLITGKVADLILRKKQ